MIEKFTEGKKIIFLLMHNNSSKEYCSAITCMRLVILVTSRRCNREFAIYLILLMKRMILMKGLLREN